MLQRTLRGFGDSGETEFETAGMPTDGMIDFSSGELDPSVFYPDPGYNIETKPLPDPAAQSWSRKVAGIIAADSAQWAAAVTGRRTTAAPRSGSASGEPGGAATFGAWAAQNKGAILATAAALFLLALAGAGGRNK